MRLTIETHPDNVACLTELLDELPDTSVITSIKIINTNTAPAVNNEFFTQLVKMLKNPLIQSIVSKL